VRYCTNCGAAVTDGHKFCTNCGARLELAPGSDKHSPFTEDVNRTVAPPAKDRVPATDFGRGATARDPRATRPRAFPRPLIAFGIILVLLVTGVAVALSNKSTSPSSCSDAIKTSDAPGAKVLSYEGQIATTCANLVDFMSAYDAHLQDHTYSPIVILIFCQTETTPSSDYASHLCIDVRATPTDAYGRFEVGSVTTMNITPPTTYPSLTATANPAPLSTTPSTPPTTVIIPPQPTLSFVVTLEILAPKPARVTEVSVIENGSTLVELGKSIPITKSITFHQGVSLDFAAGGFDPETEPGAVTCRISVNGKVLDETVGSPQTGSVGCMAVAP